jgi:hypothetical protein
VFFLQRQGKAIDDGSQNFEKLSNAIEPFRFIDELEEYIVDRTPNVRPQVEEFAVYSVQCSLEKIAFARIFRIE